MKAEFWVLVTAKQARYGSDPRPWERSGAPQASVSKPTARANQVAVKIEMEVPDSFFEQPQISAKIKIPDGAGSRTGIVAEMKKSAAAHLKKEFGVTIQFEQEPP